MTASPARNPSAPPAPLDRPRRQRISLGVSLICFVTGLGLSLNYPLGAAAALIFGLATALFFVRPQIWLIATPGLLPIIGWAPLTGWLTFEEIDLLVLAAAAAGYARFAWPLMPPAAEGDKPRYSPLARLGIALFTASVLLSLWRGTADAGGFHFGWFQGYHEPMNSLRLAKCFVFSIAMESRLSSAEIDSVALVDATGQDLIRNGDFSNELSRWLFTSDRNHLPWHAKNMFLNTLLDQGGLGLLLLVTLVVAVLWRTGFGSARDHTLAPAIAGAVAGFVVVGLFDSLLDAPRVAFIFYLLLLTGLGLRKPRTVRSNATHPA